MTDMTSIFQLAISILARFEELSVDADSGQDVGYFEVRVWFI